MSRLVVIAPGRGSYNRAELGYLRRFADSPRYPEREALRQAADEIRARMGRSTVTELDDATSYSTRVHQPGENASALIFTCSAADYMMIDPKHEIVATLGNSMGWYTTLFTGGALSFEDAFKVVETMGHFQKGNIQGGQIIYPLVNEEWHIDPSRLPQVEQVLADISGRGDDHWVGISIRLGGFLVLAGTFKGIKALLEELPKIKMGSNDYPFQLARHSAFHTPLMSEASKHGLYTLHDLPWGQPRRPMIDGRGHIWRNHRTTLGALKSYTLENQVLETYDFTESVRMAIREYNPDHFVLLGPGDTLGGSIAHVLIREKWRGLDSKGSFMAAQKSERPPLIAMGRPEQAQLIIS